MVLFALESIVNNRIIYIGFFFHLIILGFRFASASSTSWHGFSIRLLFDSIIKHVIDTIKLPNKNKIERRVCL